MLLIVELFLTLCAIDSNHFDILINVNCIHILISTKQECLDVIHKVRLVLHFNISLLDVETLLRIFIENSFVQLEASHAVIEQCLNEVPIWIVVFTFGVIHNITS